MGSDGGGGGGGCKGVVVRDVARASRGSAAMAGAEMWSEKGVFKGDDAWLYLGHLKTDMVMMYF